jgi:hypothetical protein
MRHAGIPTALLPSGHSYLLHVVVLSRSRETVPQYWVGSRSYCVQERRDFIALLTLVSGKRRNAKPRHAHFILCPADFELDSDKRRLFFVMVEFVPDIVLLDASAPRGKELRVEDPEDPRKRAGCA